MLKFTGERLTTEIFNGNTIRHLHRYALTFDLIKDKIVLDIACGEGYGSNLMADFAKEVYGIDIDSETINHASTKYKRENLNYLVGNTERIPLKNNSVDVIVSFETIEHLDKHDEMLLEFKRILKPSGVVILSSPDKYVNGELFGVKNEFHVKELYFDEFKTLIHKYFSFSSFYFQKEVFGSLIVSEMGTNIKEYCGDYTKINSFQKPHEFTFNICVCSNETLEYKLPNSYFNGYDLYLNELDGLKTKVDLLNNEILLLNNKISNKKNTSITKFFNLFNRIFRYIVSKA